MSYKILIPSYKRAHSQPTIELRGEVNFKKIKK